MKVRSAETKMREQPAEGTHAGRLLSIIDLGHQPGFTYQGKKIESAWKMEFTYELVNHTMADGRPFVVSEEVANNDWEDTKSGKRSTLVARARSLLGSDYKKGLADIESLLAQPCMVTVEYNEKGYARVRGQAAVGSVPFGMDVKELTNKPYVFDLDSPDMDVWQSMPEFKQNKIKEALNFDSTELAKSLALEEDQF